MTKEDYHKRMKEIYNQIGALASEREKMIVDMCNLIRDDLEAKGLRFGDMVEVEYGGVNRENKRTCTYNGVRVGQLNYIYIELTYPMDIDEIRLGMSREYVINHPHIVDPNYDITIKLPNGDIDYHTYMNQFV